MLKPAVLGEIARKADFKSFSSIVRFDKRFLSSKIKNRRIDDAVMIKVVVKTIFA